jgi:putative heme-binding domain-containing protein
MGMRALFFLLLLASPASAQMANRPPAPWWLVTEKPTPLTREVRHAEKLLKAVLLTVAEAPVEVLLDGKAVSIIMPTTTATGTDLTEQLGDGQPHEIGLRLPAKARVAALLELNGDLAAVRWIVTDASWQNAVVSGSTEADPSKNPFDLKKAFDAYNSWQLAKPGAQNQATEAATLSLPPGFKAELVRSAQPGEDSWVAMAFDEQGRLTLAKEKKGLLRLTFLGDAGTPARAEPSSRAGVPASLKRQQIEVIDDELLECRGLLYAHGSLFANANNTKALVRLTDTNGDGTFDERKELMRTGGGVGHGRNHIKLGPDGDIYVAHGNNVLLPEGIAADSPLKNYANDQLIANPWDGSMFDGNVELPAGHILRVKPDGSKITLLAGGLRNPLDIAFNSCGELFTFDADMERDVGTPWYMPTRVLHVVPGADFGWRRGTGRFPAWYADTLPSVIDIGLSSPTGIFFGYGAAFPKKYQEALDLLDWSYGRIIAVHFGKVVTQEDFITGRPLNVTDGCIGPDGAMWFITGGRGTQSGLYRVTCHDRSDGSDQTDLEIPERFIEHQKRLSLENRPVAEWRAEALRGGEMQALLALARVGEKADLEPLLDAVLKAAPKPTLDALRVIAVAIARQGEPTQKDRLAAWAVYPSEETFLNRELCRLLVYLKSPTVIEKTTPLLQAATSSEDLLFYPFMLRHLKDGWTLEQRKITFEALNKAEKMTGASTFFKAISDTRSELAAALKPEEATQLAAIIHPPKPAALSPHALPGHSFKNWTLADLEPQLAKMDAKSRSRESARDALVRAQCVFCHRVSTDATLPAGVFGPDLVQVSARFGRKDLLDHILNPSKFIDEKFRLMTVKTSDGKTHSGSLESEDDERVVLKPNPIAPETVEIGKSMIQERSISEVSPMPPGLLNALKAEQILDLLAWFENGAK